MKNVNASAELNTTVATELKTPAVETVAAEPIVEQKPVLNEVIEKAATAKRQSFDRPKWLGPAAAGISAGLSVSLGLILERRNDEEENKLSTAAILGATAAATVSAAGLQFAAEKCSKTLGSDEFFHVSATAIAYATAAASIVLVRPAVAKLNEQFDSVDAMIEEAVTVEEA